MDVSKPKARAAGDKTKAAPASSTPEKGAADKGPSARWMHSAAAIEKKMVVFGGCTPKYLQVDAELWFYDTGELIVFII